MPSVEIIDLPMELRRIASEMDRAGMNPDPRVVYCTSKYDSDLLRDAAKAMEDRRAEPTCHPAVERLASAARVLLDRYNAYDFPEDWHELEVALAPFERPAGDDNCLAEPTCHPAVERLLAAAKYYQSCADDGLLDEDERKHAAAIHAVERLATGYGKNS